ncbi:MAG: nitroreductase family protein, partial [Candidatus Cryosericum sp.]
MDTYESIATKLDVREFAKKQVPRDTKRKILEAARLTGSSMNTQHWCFILIQERSNLEKLAADSTSGQWIAGADFAVLILVNPKVPGYMIDAGR